MTSSSDSRRLKLGRPGPVGVSVAVAALLVFVASFMVWHHLGDAWREVDVVEARLISPKRLELLIATCSAPEVSLWESDVDIQVKAMSASPPSRGDVSCGGTVEFELQNPLGDRVIIDEHTGQVVKVMTLR